MGVGAHTGCLRTGLVALLFLFACASGFSQDLRRSTEKRAETSVESMDLTLKDPAEIEKSNCKRRYSNPLNLLFLLPGVVFFLLALTTRRRYRKLFPFFSLLLLLGSSEPDPFPALRQAEENFGSGSYLEAMKIYQRVEQVLPCNSALLYNLGVVSHYLDQRGHAVHYLRRSLRQAPGDRRVRVALRRLEHSYDLAGQVAPPFPVHPDIAFLLLLLFANVTFILGAFVVRTKKVRFLISLVLVAIAALGCSAFFVGRLLAESRSVGVVISEQGELYRVPEEDSKSWFELPVGTSLWIRGQSGQYYLVETSSQIEGWVRSDTILID